MLLFLPPTRLLAMPTMPQFLPCLKCPAVGSSTPRMYPPYHPVHPKRLRITLMLAGALRLAPCRRPTPGSRSLSDVVHGPPPLAKTTLLRFLRLAASRVVPLPRYPRLPQTPRPLWNLPPTIPWLLWIRIFLRVYGPLRRLH